MADTQDKVPGTVDGAYFVDTNCIDCDLCRQTAPENFDRNDDEGYSFVKKQPANDEEAQLCRDALDDCPVEAIGDDG